MTKGKTRQLCCISVIRVLVTKQGQKYLERSGKGSGNFNTALRDEIPRPGPLIQVVGRRVTSNKLK
jgi:hypothetical protein